MTIGLIGAMDCEITEIKNSMSLVNEKIVSGMTFYNGLLNGKEVVLVKCGVGKVFAGIATEILIVNFGVTHVINIGVAGSVVSSLKIGDIVVSSAVVQHDMNTSAIGDPVGLVSGVNKIFFDADTFLVDSAVSAGEKFSYNVCKGVVASGDLFVEKNSTKHYIADNFNAVCAEMEGGAVGQVAFINNVPFVVIRSISDDGDNSHKIEFATFAVECAKKVGNVVKEMIKNL